MDLPSPMALPSPITLPSPMTLSSPTTPRPPKPLPTPTRNQPFCRIAALEGGFFECPESLLIKDAQPGARRRMPVLCFLIDHSTSHKKILVDCGLRKDLHSYGVPAIDALIHSSPLRYSVPRSCLESLADGVLAPHQIDIVFITHCHFDHVGNAPSFLTSQFVVGGDTRELFEQAYPEDPLSLFADDTLPKDRTTYIEEHEWVRVGPFPRTRDFFGDGSLYLVDAPGHLPGHMNVLARTSADGAWIYLAGDSCYHSKVSTGEASIAEGTPWDPNFCIHTHKGNTEATLHRIQEFRRLPRTQVIFSHDLCWYEKNKGGSAFWPGTIRSA